MTKILDTAAKTAAAPILNNCICSQFEIVLEEFEVDGQPDYTSETTGCNETTAREFAPGHDAKLKSLLIRAGVQGLGVRRNTGGVAYSGEAANMAREFAFGYMVQTGIERGRAKAAASAEKKAARKSAPKAAKAKTAEMPRKVGAHVVAAIGAAVAEANAPEGPAVLRELLTLDAPATETVEIRVGRWAYQATIVDGDAHYVTAKGAAAVAVKGTYKMAA